MSQLIHIYCDESRQTRDRYMVLGGSVIEGNSIDRFNDTMRAYREQHTMNAELKWSRVTNNKYEKYKEFVNFFFALNDTDNLHFHALIIDNHQADHSRFNQGNHELGMYKFFYQLLLHSFGPYCLDANDRAIVCFDDGHSGFSLSEYREILNNGLAKKHGCTHRPFVSVEVRNSKECEVLQVNDIILGAIGFQKNGYHLLADSRQAKKDLSKYIAAKAGLPDLARDTRYGVTRFKIWNFRMRPNQKRQPKEKTRP